MIAPPKCYDRNCKHYLGVDQPDGTEMTERVICEAYPEGIPGEIAYGTYPHLKVREDQDNEIVFEENQ